LNGGIFGVRIRPLGENRKSRSLAASSGRSPDGDGSENFRVVGGSKHSKVGLLPIWGIQVRGSMNLEQTENLDQEGSTW